MRLRQCLVAIIGVLTLLMPHVSPGFGDGNDPAGTSSVTILPGDPISTLLTRASIERQTRSSAGETLTGSMIVRVRDVRGVATGWTLTLAAQDYIGPAGHIDSGLLVVSPAVTTVVRGNSDRTGISTHAVDSLSTSPVPLWTAAELFGDGQYDLMLEIALGLPDDPQAGFLYTVIVSIGGSAP